MLYPHLKWDSHQTVLFTYNVLILRGINEFLKLTRVIENPKSLPIYVSLMHENLTYTNYGR